MAAKGFKPNPCSRFATLKSSRYSLIFAAVRPEHHFDACFLLRTSSSILGQQPVHGGESGIRTHGTLRYTRFPSVRLKPLGHLSRGSLARWGSTTASLTLPS
jgi:hypothetical protein